MITVALVGGPGSGKTELAEALAERLEKEGTFPTLVVDDYAQSAGEHIDAAIGFRADYYVNLAIAIERIAREKKAETEVGEDGAVITAGSLLETSVYTAMQFERRNAMIKDEAVKQDMLRRVEATLKTLACFYMDSFFYDCVFYCPPTDQTDEEFKTFDKNLQASFQAFYLNPVYILKSEGVENRVNEMLEHLKKVEEAEDESDAEGSGTSPQKAS